MYGNGRPGPTASGVRTGKIVPWNVAASSPRSERRDLGRRAAPRRPLPRSSASSSARQRALALDELAHPCAHAVEHLGGQQVAGGARTVGGVAHRLQQLGHAHHAELVEVGREDGGEAQPLEQRDALVAGQLEHARVPLEPRQLAIEEPRLLGRLLARRTAITQLPAISASARGRRNQRSSPRWPAIGSIAAAAALGNETRAPVTACTSTEKSGSWPTSTRSSPWRSARPARSSASTPSSAASSASGAPSSSAMISAVSCARGYGLVTTHSGSTLQRRQRAAGGARGAASGGHEARSGSGLPSARSSASACRTRMIATASA